MAAINTVYLLLGGNLGNRAENLRGTLQLLEKKAGKVVLCSAVYETEPWGFEDEKAFYNQAVQLQSSLSPQALLKCIHEIEDALGRQRNHERFSARTMDIDILFFNEDMINEPELLVPHPQITKRRFALIPLAEIAPELKHPQLDKSILQLLAECEDTLRVRNLNTDI